MSKSLLRWHERLLLFTCYLICFIFNILFDYIKALRVDSFLLESYLSQFYDYQVYIMFAVSFIVVMFHYKISNIKKDEIYCRYVVGDSLRSISIRYGLDCLLVLLCAYIISAFIISILKLSKMNNIYLSCCLCFYILISSLKVGKKYENF